MSLRVLIVEDHAPSRNAMERLLRREKFEVDSTATVAEAQAKLNRGPQLLVLDLMLPDGNGVAVLARLRELRMACKVAVVSAANDPELFRRVEAFRPDAVFGKPLDVTDFLAWLRALTASEQALPQACA